MTLSKCVNVNMLLRSRRLEQLIMTLNRSYSGKPKVPEPNRYFKRWQDIPDEFVKTYSERDPVNTVYRTKEWVNFKKKQIFFQQDPNIWTQFAYGRRSLMQFYGLMVVCVSLSVYGIAMIHKDDYLIYRKKLKQMREENLDWKTPKEYLGVAVITPEMVGAE